MERQTVKTALPLCIVCVLSVFLQSGILPGLAGIAAVIPYIAFCVCALLINRGCLRAANVLKILAIACLALPLFDFLYINLVSARGTTLLSVALFAFLQTAVYFAAFVLVSGCVDRENYRAVGGGVWLILAVLALGHSLAEGIITVQGIRMLQQAFESGSMLCIVPPNVPLSCLASLLFYGGLFLLAAKMAVGKAKSE